MGSSSSSYPKSHFLPRPFFFITFSFSFSSSISFFFFFFLDSLLRDQKMATFPTALTPFLIICGFSFLASASIIRERDEIRPTLIPSPELLEEKAAWEKSFNDDGCADSPDVCNCNEWCKLCDGSRCGNTSRYGPTAICPAYCAVCKEKKCKTIDDMLN